MTMTPILISKACDQWDRFMAGSINFKTTHSFKIFESHWIVVPAIVYIV